jgi:crotonobetainyl-CoA:carnitine CoA-transferase CaiB-like acyl-CoA transferase
VKLSGSTHSSTPDGHTTARARSASGPLSRERPPRRGAPRLGEHTREVLEEAGWTAWEVDALIEKKVAAAPV